MKNIKTSFFSTKVFFLSLIVPGMLFCVANDAKALTLSPPTYEIGATPGQTLTTGLKVFNETDKGGSFYFDTQNFTAKGDNGEPYFVEEPIKSDLASWIQTPVSIDLAPGELKRVEFTINVPANADPGGHYAAVFLNTSPGEPAPGSVSISSKIGTLVLLRVEGDIVEMGKLADFSADKKGIYDHLPVNFSVVIDNPGTVFIKPSGKITISNIFGQKTDELNVNIGRMPDGTYKPVGNILSKSSRKFTSAWTKNGESTEPGDFFGALKFEMANFALGRYSAKLDLTYGVKDDKKITGSLTFWVFPWRILLIGFALLAVIVIILIVLVKSYNGWIIKKAKESLQKENKK